MTKEQIIKLVVAKKKIAQRYVSELQHIENELMNGAELEELAIGENKLSDTAKVYWFEAFNTLIDDDEEYAAELHTIDGATQLHFVYDKTKNCWI